jgi:hypothetical protein
MEKDREKRAKSAGRLMRWAATQLGQDPATLPTVPGDGRGSAEASTLAPGPEPQPEPMSWADALRGWARRSLAHAAVYAPIWIATYLLGRTL